MGLAPEQKQSLLAAKLRALVTNEDLPWRRVASSLTVAPFAAGVGLTDKSTGTAWLLVEPRVVEVHIDAMPDVDADPNPHGWLGGAMAWAHKRNISSVHILLDSCTAHDTRRSTVFTDPPHLWQIVGRNVVELVPEAFEETLVSEDHLHEFSPQITAAGADVVVDHGVIRAEVLGLEVGRVLAGEDGVVRLDVGVGKHDRLANAMLGNTNDIVSALGNAVDEVRSRRSAIAAPHPANQLARERWLRDIVRAKPALADPALAGASLQPIESVRPAMLKQLGPALLLDADQTTLVACSVGLDLDAAVDAADVRNRVAPNARIVLVLPEQDALASQHTIAESIANCAITTVIDDWKSL